MRGGIPNPAFSDIIVQTFAGSGYVEDLPRMTLQQPLMNSYWQDKIARLDRIDVPAYVVASYTNPLHTTGTFRGFHGIASTQKWLRVHNTHEWSDYYQCSDDLRRFFDYFLKGDQNGWESTRRVRLSIVDPVAPMSWTGRNSTSPRSDHLPPGPPQPRHAHARRHSLEEDR